ncbi:unnamed protein product [Heligmosomoides polygyrus]|uniref:YTH domain-containing protein n=1 Tax=Heligmosomoides polygyrus TaxID=6339 RepID=A0A183G6H6_HELPZ|nr:unnamed protein product [Heligmosomoides polygyrus]
MNHIVHAVQGEAAIVDGRSPTNVGSQFDGTPQSLSAGGFGKTDENGDTYISSSLDGSIYPYQLQNWISPRSPYPLPYYNNLLYTNQYANMNRFGYGFNQFPYRSRMIPYQQTNPYIWKNFLPSSPSDSDLQFTYLMTNPQAARAYQGLAYRE